MSDPETREMRRRKRERNLIAKDLRSKKFHQKVIPNKKKQKQINIKNYDEFIEE